MRLLQNIWTECGGWLAPQQCCCCAQPLPIPEVICTDCRQGLPWNVHACRRCGLPIEAGMECGACLTHAPAFTRCITPFRYEPPISTFIIQLKFQQQLRYARVLGRLLAESITLQSRALPECIIPVPLHTQRIRQRGFNQAIEIAKPLGKALSIPLFYDHCYRRKNTLPQSQLSASARRRNLAAAFGLRKTSVPRRVAIVDDVMTTGQTVRVLSQMLHNEGVEQIDIWCCARAV